MANNVSFQDCTGGVLSITQLLLDAYLSGDWSGVSGVSNYNSTIVNMSNNINFDE